MLGWTVVPRESATLADRRSAMTSKSIPRGAAPPPACRIEVWINPPKIPSQLLSATMLLALAHTAAFA